MAEWQKQAALKDIPKNIVMKRSRLAKAFGRLKRRKLPKFVDIKHHRITVGEALERLEHGKTWTIFSLPPVLKRYRKSFYEDVEHDIKQVAPRAKIEYLPKQWMIRGVMKDPFQDIKVSNITAGEAIILGFELMPKSATWKS
jgi:hypothetical protein